MFIIKLEPGYTWTNVGVVAANIAVIFAVGYIDSMLLRYPSDIEKMIAKLPPITLVDYVITYAFTITLWVIPLSIAVILKLFKVANWTFEGRPKLAYIVAFSALGISILTAGGINTWMEYKVEVAGYKFCKSVRVAHKQEDTSKNVDFEPLRRDLTVPVSWVRDSQAFFALV